MPSAWTPTTSKRWMTALKRKRRGWRMIAANAISTAPRKPSRPYIVLTASDDPLADLVEHAKAAGASSGLTLTGCRRGDMVEQQLPLLARADDLGAAVADGAVDQPGADRVDLFDPAERSIVSGSGTASISRCVVAAREIVSEPRTRYGCASDAGSDVVDWPAIGRDPARNRPERQARLKFASLLPEFMPYSACTMTSDEPRAAKPLFVTVGDNPARAFRHERGRTGPGAGDQG